MSAPSNADVHSAARSPIPAPIVESLRCPLCHGHLVQEARRLVCHNGHSFDRAKQGHVSLRLGKPTPLNADSPPMVTARESLLGTGLYSPIRTRASNVIARHMPRIDAPLVADLAGGTGYYLSGILDAVPGSFGICFDLSKPALQRAARCHPRAAGIGSDLRYRLPLASNSASAATSFFGPRNVPEIRRVLRDGGIFAVVTPTVKHLTELVDALGMLKVDESKDERLAASLHSFTVLAADHLHYQATISREQARNIASMGPSAHHITQEELDGRVSQLPAIMAVTIAVNLAIYV